MRIAVIGAGNVGGALGAAFRRAGHEVTFGVRDPDSAKTRGARAAADGAVAASPAEAVSGADVVVFALRWEAVSDVVGTLPRLDGTVVVDAMNRFGGDGGRSTADDLVALLPGARVVKAFNTTGFENLASGAERRTPAAMFVAGDDDEAKRVAMDLAAQIGFEPEDVGPLANAKPLEEMVKVWLALSRVHGRRVAFSLSLD